MRNVLIISSSLRNGSNSEQLALEFAKGAKNNNNVEYVSLKNLKINFCIGCLSCQKNGKCIFKDDVNEILEKVKNADVLVFATPIYYYGLSGQLKTLLDRLNPLYASKYNFKEVYMIATAAENEEETFDKAYISLKGWVDCFDNVELKAIIKGGGVDSPNSILKEKTLLKIAYEEGKRL